MPRVPAFGWHQGPTGPTKALQAYPQNFVTVPRTLRILYIDLHKDFFLDGLALNGLKYSHHVI